MVFQYGWLSYWSWPQQHTPYTLKHWLAVITLQDINTRKRYADAACWTVSESWLSLQNSWWLTPFSFYIFITERFMLSLTRDHISENQYVKITSGYWFDRESWVIRTLLLSQCIESHMATKVPSPIISMTERTALCPPMDSTRKQRTRV